MSQAKSGMRLNLTVDVGGVGCKIDYGPLIEVD